MCVWFLFKNQNKKQVENKSKRSGKKTRLKLTNLIILISIQLLVEVVISLKNTGARGR